MPSGDFALIDRWAKSSLHLVVGQFEWRENLALAMQTPWAHNAIMEQKPIFTTDIAKDIGNPNRFRWNIYENMKVRDKSFYSFATKREAQNDADKFIRKLDDIWR
jgi:hypothetical protein